MVRYRHRVVAIGRHGLVSAPGFPTLTQGPKMAFTRKARRLHHWTPAIRVTDSTALIIFGNAWIHLRRPTEPTLIEFDPPGPLVKTQGY